MVEMRRAGTAAVVLALGGAALLLLAGVRHAQRSSQLLEVLPAGQQVVRGPMLWGRFLPGIRPDTISPERAEAEFVYYQQKYGPHVEVEKGPAFYENAPEDSQKLPGVNKDSGDWPFSNFPYMEAGKELDSIGSDGRPDPVFQPIEVPRQGYPIAEEGAEMPEEAVEGVEGEAEPAAQHPQVGERDESAVEHAGEQPESPEEAEQEPEEEETEQAEEQAANRNTEELVVRPSTLQLHSPNPISPDPSTLNAKRFSTLTIYSRSQTLPLKP